MKKIVCITGTRPQLIKHAVLAKCLQLQFHVISLYTGQHYDYALHEGLKKELFRDVQFHNLEIENNDVPATRLGAMLVKISAFLQVEKPDAVLVYGDTDSTLAGALAANKMKHPLIHVEAGERSFNRDMPEEHNRVLTDALADILFCASQTAMQHLHKESISAKLFYSGDLMKDLLMQKSQLFQKPIVADPYLFCTIHRNYTNQNITILEALLHALAQTKQSIIFPVHPATQTSIKQLQENKNKYSNIRFLPPVSYADSICYQKFAEAVITDSGGIQKEAYWLKKRCLTIRKETEWTQTLYGNWNQLLYDSFTQIPALLQAHLGAHDAQLYGDGNAATYITNHLQKLL